MTMINFCITSITFKTRDVYKHLLQSNNYNQLQFYSMYNYDRLLIYDT